MSNEEIARKLIAFKDQAENNPVMQNYLRISNLPGDIEHVRGSLRQRGYYRRKASTRDAPTPSQALHRLRFSQVAANNYGETGTTLLPDGRVVSNSALLLGDELRGNPKDKKQEEIEKLNRMLGSQNTIKVRVPWK
jgi:hypothetical protein